MNVVAQEAGLSCFPASQITFWGTFLTQKQKNKLTMELALSTSVPRQTARRNHKHYIYVCYWSSTSFYRLPTTWTSVDNIQHQK